MSGTAIEFPCSYPDSTWDSRTIMNTLGYDPESPQLSGTIMDLSFEVLRHNHIFRDHTFRRLEVHRETAGQMSLMREKECRAAESREFAGSDHSSQPTRKYQRRP